LLVQRKKPKKARPEWRDISLRFAPRSRQSPDRTSLSWRATSVIPHAALRALGPRLAMRGHAIRV
jgi:hypothetical protein